MGFMVLDPTNDRGHQIDGASKKGQEYQAVRIFGNDTRGAIDVTTIPGKLRLARELFQRDI